MEKNGFTLVEMMTVVVILVLLGLLAIFSINGVVKHSSDELYELQIANVVDAARTYAISKSSELSETNQITLCDLKRAGLIEIDFVNPKTEERFDESLIIDINKNKNGQYDVSFDVTKKMENYYCNLDGMIVTLSGNSPYYASLGDTYHDSGVRVQREKEDGSLENHDNYSIEMEGNYRDALINGVFNKVGTFTQTYVVKETTTQFRTSITRTIIVEDNTAPTISLIKAKNGSCNIAESSREYYGNSAVLVEGGNLSYPCCFSTEGTCQITDNFNNSSKPGTYEIIYKASDSAGNTTTEVLTVTVRAKNKSLLGKVIVDTFNWTNEGINLAIEPLYNASSSCNDFLYSFDAGNNWQTDNTKAITVNGTYKVGIKYNTNVCSESAEDIFTYKVENVDLESPSLASATIYVKDSNGKLITSESKYETINGELIEHKYYYSNSSLILSEPSGAVDSLSGIGVNGYTVFVNDVAQDVPEVSLIEEGRYVIELKATDRAGNESEKKEVAIIIIDKTAPICEFKECSGSVCRNNPVITGANVTYDAANVRYKVTMNSTTELVNFGLACTDTYYEKENDYLKNVEIALESFSIRNESSTIGASTVASSQFVNAESICENGICTRIYNYIIGVNVGNASTYNSDPISLRILAGAVSDKSGNSTLKNNDSMLLAKSK